MAEFWTQVRPKSGPKFRGGQCSLRIRQKRANVTKEELAAKLNGREYEVTQLSLSKRRHTGGTRSKGPRHVDLCLLFLSIFQHPIRTM